MSSRQNPFGSHADLVRKFDPDRYLLTMLMPVKFHDALLALFAFNHEIAKTREVVTETRLGLIRLQWWRDAIDEIYAGKTPRKHEVVAPLADAITRYGLSRNHFETLLYAREFDLEDVLPETLEGLSHYADFTTTPLFALAMEVMDEGGIDVNIIQPVAVNYALVNLMRVIPYHANQRRCYIPSAILDETGQSMNKLYNGKINDAFYDAVGQILSLCDFKVQAPHPLLKKANKLSSLYYNHLKSNEYRVFDVRAQAQPPLKLLRLLLP